MAKHLQSLQPSWKNQLNLTEIKLLNKFYCRNDKITEQRIVCFSYSFFFAMPLIIGIENVVISIILLLTSLFFLLFAIFAPMVLFKVTSKLSLVLSFFHSLVSNVFLFLFFYLLLSPIALILKVFGRKLVILNIEKNKCSYWRAPQESRNWNVFFKDPF